MAHYAEINKSSIVINVIVIPNEVDINELEGELYCKNITNSKNKWIKTSYNNNIRYNYAGIGYFYDSFNDAFIPPKPYNSWLLTNNFNWKAPVDYPTDGLCYTWDENQINWLKIDC